MKIEVNHTSKIPLYKQIITGIKEQIDKNQLKEGHLLPSMNQLSESLAVSKETIKTAYTILRSENYIDAAHGKGFFVKKREKKTRKVLILFDILNSYKKVLFDSFSATLNDDTDYTIRLFNQDIDLFEKFILENIGSFDYYVITPHLPINPATQKRVIQVLKKIPNRQLVLLDRHLTELPGNYISVYQDFEHDVYEGLRQALDVVRQYSKLNIYTMKRSLYGQLLEKGIKRFCNAYKINHVFFHQDTPIPMKAGEAYFLLSGQLDNELIQFIRAAKEQKLKVGKDIGIFSINESPINEIILNGLSVLSTDFIQMGQTAALYLKEEQLKKHKCDFRFIQRHTF